jgi:hypothetical protein
MDTAFHSFSSMTCIVKECERAKPKILKGEPKSSLHGELRFTSFFSELFRTSKLIQSGCLTLFTKRSEVWCFKVFKAIL